MQEKKNDKKRYVIYEDVMTEVVEVLSEYINHLEGESSCLEDRDKIRNVLHHFESGLCLLQSPQTGDKEKIEEYVELAKRQREIMLELSLDEAMDLFFALSEQGLHP